MAGVVDDGYRGPIQLTTGHLREMRRLRYEEGRSARYTAEQIGCNVGTVLRYAPGAPGKIPNAPVREAFLASGLTGAEVARRLGWLDNRRRPAGKRVRRALGLLPTQTYTTKRTGERKHYYSHRVDAEIAGAIAEAIGVPPWQIGANDVQAA